MMMKKKVKNFQFVMDLFIMDKLLNLFVWELNLHFQDL